MIEDNKLLIDEVEKQIATIQSDIDYYERKLKGLNTMMYVHKEVLKNLKEKG